MRPENVERMKARARNIALKVAYDGTNYHGFQRQMPPVVAVQNARLGRSVRRRWNSLPQGGRMRACMPTGRW